MRLRTDIDGTTSQHVVVIVSPGIKDYNHYQKTGEISLDNTIDAATDIAVSWAGASAGASVGSRFGMLIGGALGIGVVPMTIIGCAVGGILGPQIFDEITSFIGN